MWFRDWCLTLIYFVIYFWNLLYFFVIIILITDIFVMHSLSFLHTKYMYCVTITAGIGGIMLSAVRQLNQLFTKRSEIDCAALCLRVVGVPVTMFVGIYL